MGAIGRSQTIGVLMGAGVALSLVGCALSSQNTADDSGTRLTAGDQIVLRAAVPVLPGSLDGWLMLGETMRSSLAFLPVSDNRVRCAFQLSRPVSRQGIALVIEPGVFTVERELRESRPWGFDPRWSTVAHDFATDVTLIYRVRLRSTEQPHVVGVQCQQRHAVLTRRSRFPDAESLKQVAGPLLSWPVSAPQSAP